MLLLYNNQMLEEKELRLSITNRAFQYNDGFFETIIIREGKLFFWEEHVQRMQEAASALQLQLPAFFAAPEFNDKLLLLAKKQQALHHGRLKLKVWRAGGGLYTPETDVVEWLAIAQQSAPVSAAPIHISICLQVHAHYSPVSHFKGPHAPLYVLAAMEKKARQLDDMLLTDQQGNIAELTSSNICWFQDGKLYTPALATGCINGVLRRNILRWCQSLQIEVVETMAGLEKLLQAELVFAANVTGIRVIKSIEGKALPTNHPLLHQLQKDLFGQFI
jgi:branched-chain amino acid aminotransferase/4-amino-4-deoxychorismate lyase